MLKNLIRLSLLLFVTSMTIFSCNKENISTETEKISQSEEAVIQGNEIDILSFVGKSRNGEKSCMEFGNVKEFRGFCNAISGLSKFEKKSLLGKIPFTTAQQQKELIYSQIELLDDVNDETEFFNLIENSNLIYIDYSDEEEPVVEENIPRIGIMKDFVNQDLIVKIGAIYHKYFRNVVVQSEDYESLERLNSINDIKRSGLQFYEQFSDELNTTRWGNLSRIKTWTETINKKGCRKDRRLCLTFGTDVINNASERFLWGIAEAKPQRKRFCVWVKYKTVVTWKTFDTLYDLKYKDGSVSSHVWYNPSKEETTNCMDRSRQLTAWDAHFWADSEIVKDLQWNKVIHSVTTRGLGGVWLDINHW